MTVTTAFNTLNTTLDIIEKAGRTVVNHPATPGVLTAVKVADKVSRTGGAITQLTNQTTILSRAFVDERVIDEPILPNVMRLLHSWYTAQVIAGLQLGQMISDQSSVQDVMRVVQTGQNTHATGAARNVATSVWSSIRNRRTAQESFLSNYLGTEVSSVNFGLEDLYGPMTHAQTVASNTRAWKAESDKRADSAKTVEEKVDVPAVRRDNDVTIRSIDHDQRIGPMGQLFEVKLTNPNGNGQSTVVPIFIQMQPSIIPDEVGARFIDMNVAPSTWQRWTQMRAGELTFWRDFLLNRDMIRRQKSLIKDKKTADAFSDFLRTVAKKDKYAAADATDRLGSRQSANLANSVMIFSEDAVGQAKADSGIDLHNPTDRARYFRDTYTMIVVVIDTLHQRVTVYFNGVDGEINAPYNEFRPKDTKFDPKDFMVALQAFTTGSVSRMR